MPIMKQSSERLSLSSATFFLLTLAVAHLIVPAVAFANKPKRVKVLVLKVESETLAAGAKAAATKAIRTEVAKYPHVNLLPTPDVELLDLMLDMECTDVDVECLSKIGKKFGGQRLLFTEVKTEGAGTVYRMRLINVSKRKSLKDVNKTLSNAAAAAGLVTAVLGPVPVKKPPVKPKTNRVPVVITSNIPGARVVIGKIDMGTVPVKTNLRRGRYRIKISKAGFKTLRTRLNVKGKGTTAVKFHYNLNAVAKPLDTKTPVDVPPSKTPKVKPVEITSTPFYKEWWFWTAVGVGVAGIVTTAVLLSIDDDPLPTGGVRFGTSAPDHDPRVLGQQ